jgi:oxygen-independent coproporphyrinogen-3 oxidase
MPEMRPDLSQRWNVRSGSPQLSTAVGAETYARWLKDIPFHACASLHVHAPFGGHDGVPRREPVAFYEAALRCEIELVSRLIERRLKVGRVHFGGKPTVMAPEAINELIVSVRQSFFVLPSADISVEINPRTLTAPMIDALALGGVHRAKVMVQSFDTRVQRAVNGLQSLGETAAAIDGLRRAGIAGIDFDLVYGLPHQTVASCLDTVRRCLGLRPGRFSVRGYVDLPQAKKEQHNVEEAWLPDERERNDQASAIGNALKEAGYLQTGPADFVRSGDGGVPARHENGPRPNFENPSATPGHVLLGFGAGAIGCLPRGYVQNEISISAYSESIAGGNLATERGRELATEERGPAISA